MNRSMIQFTTLIKRFPSLVRFAPADDERFDPVTFEARVMESAPGSGTVQAMRFILNLWDDQKYIVEGKGFNIFAAVRVWDTAHLRAFQEWAANPWRA